MKCAMLNRPIDTSVPCYGCKNRHEACWSDCPEYAKFHARRVAVYKARKDAVDTVAALGKNEAINKKRRNQIKERMHH